MISSGYHDIIKILSRYHDIIKISRYHHHFIIRYLDIFKPSLKYHQNQLKQLLVFKKSYLFKAFNMYSCAYCEYSTSYLQNLKRHEKNKHDKSKHALSQTGSGADVPMEQTAPSHFHNEKHSNLQEESIDQLHENIDQLQKAYDTLKEQYQHVEKVTTCNDGRPSII